MTSIMLVVLDEGCCPGDIMNCDEDLTSLGMLKKRLFMVMDV